MYKRQKFIGLIRIPGILERERQDNGFPTWNFSIHIRQIFEIADDCCHKWILTQGFVQIPLPGVQTDSGPGLRSSHLRFAVNDAGFFAR